jgi:hypothetical protein
MLGCSGLLRSHQSSSGRKVAAQWVLWQKVGAVSVGVQVPKCCWESHMPTWLPTVSLPFAILTLVNTPYKRGFYCADDSIRYPYRPDTITHGLMAGVTITGTVLLVRQEGL